MTRSKPEEAWSQLLQVIATTDDAGLFWVADSIEDLVGQHRHAFVAVLEPELATNRRLREAFVHFVPIDPDNEPPEDRLLELRKAIEREFGVA